MDRVQNSTTSAERLLFSQDVSRPHRLVGMALKHLLYLLGAIVGAEDQLIESGGKKPVDYEVKEGLAVNLGNRFLGFPDDPPESRPKSSAKNDSFHGLSLLPKIKEI
jgi:hypothetical protein